MPERLAGPSEPELLEVIHDIHAAARDPSLWPGVLGKVLAIVAPRAGRSVGQHLVHPAVAAGSQPHAVTQAAVHALERLNFGVVLLGPEGELRHANRRADDISHRTRAYAPAANGRLQASVAAHSAKLHKAVQAAAQGGGARDLTGTPLRLRGAGGTDVHAFVVPVPAGTHHLEQPVVAMMFVADPQSTLPNFADKLRQIYRLSPSEAQLAEALVNGRSLKQFAVERGTSLNTVRTQLRSLAAKVGAKRQLDVVRCLLTGPAVLDL